MLISFEFCTFQNFFGGFISWFTVFNTTNHSETIIGFNLQINKNNVYNIKTFTDVDSGINYLKTFKFNDIIIIISGSLFMKFVNKFKKNIKQICVIPKIIIFSSKIRNFPYLENKKFFLFGGVQTSFEKIKIFIDNIYSNKSKNNEENYSQGQSIFNNNQIIRVQLSSQKLIFDQIKNEKDLILPVFYKILVEVSETKDNDQFINNTYEKFKNDKQYIELLNQMKSVPDIPMDILSKYYIRLYTIEGNFYKFMKNDLLSDFNQNNVIYQSYIKTLYEGVENNSLNKYNGQELYSAQNLSDEEIQELLKYKNDKISNLPMSVIFSKGFLSFTKAKNVAEYFIQNFNKNTLLTIVGSRKEFNLDTHADIEELSFYKNEKEVLFFPFSAFAIEDFMVDEETKINNIKLTYLGKYIKKFENDKKFNISTDKLPNTRFKELFKKSGLVKEDVIDNMKINDISNKYKEYKSKKFPPKLKKILLFVFLGIIVIGLAVSLPIILTRKSDDDDKIKIKTIDDCLGGTYFDSNKSDCFNCYPGYYSKGKTEKCSRCPEGQSSKEKADSCFYCPPGTYSNDKIMSCTT